MRENSAQIDQLNFKTIFVLFLNEEQKLHKGKKLAKLGGYMKF